MDELSPQAEAKDLELAATRGFVPGERLSEIHFRQSQGAPGIAGGSLCVCILDQG